MDLVLMMIALLGTLGLLFVVTCGAGTDGKADEWKPSAFADVVHTNRIR